MGRVFPLLSLCARVEQHQIQAELLLKACERFTSWGPLLEQAESHGMSPLLYSHLRALDFPCPDHVKRSLYLLYLRHQQANTTRMKALAWVLSLFNQNGVESLLLKGVALCQTVYPDSGLRPMRDVDLMVAGKDAVSARELLLAEGYSESGTRMPADHFHLSPLQKMIDGVPVCMELHTGLFSPSCPPFTRNPDYAELSGGKVEIEVEGVKAATFSHENTLWYLYQHGFHAPLTYEQYRTINAADIISFVEKYHTVLDWEMISRKWPPLRAALVQFHWLSPWQESVKKAVMPEEPARPSGVGRPFQGWPQQRLKEMKGAGAFHILSQTFFPSPWWVRLYYGSRGRLSSLRHRFCSHPVHIFWWIRHFTPYLLEQASGIKEEIAADRHDRHYRWSSFAGAVVSLAGKLRKK